MEAEVVPPCLALVEVEVVGGLPSLALVEEVVVPPFLALVEVEEVEVHRPSYLAWEGVGEVELLCTYLQEEEGEEVEQLYQA